MDVATLSIAVESRQVKDATREMDTMSKAGGKLEGVVKGIAAAWASWKVVQYAREAATLAARYETLGAVMGVVGNNAGYTMAQMATFEAGLTETGISMIGARDALTMMAGAQMDLTKSSQMARIAQDAAVIGNINSSEAFQRMVQGIRSGETEILRTIGISVNFEQAYAKVSRQLGKTAKDLTDTEKLIARQNVVMEYGSKIAGAYEASMGTAGKQLLSMKRYAEDLQVVFGAIFSDAFGVVVQTLNSALADTKKWLTENGEAAAIMKLNIGLAAQDFVGLVKDVMGTASGMASMNDELTGGEILAGGLALSMAVIRDAVMTVVGLGQKFSANMLAVPQAVGEAVRWVMGLFNIQPPQWLQKVIGLRDEQITKANKNMMGGAISQFYNGAPRDLFAEVDAENAAAATAKAERERIKAANKAKQEAEASKRKEQAMQAAAKASAEYRKHVSQLNEELDKERILLEYGAIAAERFSLWKKGWKTADIDAITAKRSLLEADKAEVKMLEVTADLAKKNIAEKLKLKDANDEYAQSILRMMQDAARVTDQFLTPKQGFEKDKGPLDSMLGKGLISLDTYKSAIKSIDPVWTDTFGSMARTLDDFSQRGTDAFVDFCFTGKAQFSDLITSMLRDLARLTVQKNVMGPLFDLLGVGINYLAGGGAGNNNLGSQGLPSTFLGTGTGGGLTGLGGFNINDSAGSGFAVPQSSKAAVSSQIIIHVASDGSASTKNNGTAMAQEMQRSVEPMVLQVIDKHMRPGGRLNPTRGGGMV